MSKDYEWHSTLPDWHDYVISPLCQIGQVKRKIKSKGVALTLKKYLQLQCNCAMRWQQKILKYWKKGDFDFWICSRREGTKRQGPTEVKFCAQVTCFFFSKVKNEGWVAQNGWLFSFWQTPGTEELKFFLILPKCCN